MNDDYTNSEYFNEKDKKRLSRMLMLSRAESGISQEKVALELGIAKRTVQNWERGVSAPTLPQAIEWFRVMKVAAMPYFLQFMFPEIEGINPKNDDETIKANLIKLIETMPPEGVRQLMYLFYGNHGSSPRAVMNMVTAHLQTPLKDRYTHASMILNDYNLYNDKVETVKPEHVQPDTEYLETAISQSRKSILQDKKNYITV